MDRAQRRVILFRDVTCILVGATGFLHQVFVAPEANLILVTASVNFLLAPTGLALWAQRKSVGLNTTEPSSRERGSSSSVPPSHGQ